MVHRAFISLHIFPLSLSRQRLTSSVPASLNGTSITPSPLSSPCPLPPRGLNSSLFYFNRVPHIYPGPHPLPITYSNPHQSAVNAVSMPYTYNLVRWGRGQDNSHKAHPRNACGDHISCQNAYTVDEWQKRCGRQCGNAVSKCAVHRKHRAPNDTHNHSAAVFTT